MLKSGRRDLLCSSVTLLAGCGGVARSRETTEGPASWTEYNRTARHNGLYRAGHVRDERPSRRTGVELRGAVVSSPVASRNTVAVGDESGLKLLHREKQVDVTLSGQFTRTPAIRDGTVYATTQGTTASLCACEPTGEKVWTRSFDAERVSMPVTADGTVFVSTATAHYAIDTDGEVSWSVGDGLDEIDAGVLTTDNLGPAVTDEMVVFTTGQEVVAVERETGTIRWRTPVGRTWSAPAAGTDYIYVPSVDRGLVAVALESGRVSWRWTETPCWATPAVAEDRVYAAAGHRPAALDAATGDVIWRGDSLRGSVSSGLTVVGETILTHSHGLGLVAIGTDGVGPFDRGGWHYDDGVGSYATPLVVEDRIVFVQRRSGRSELTVLE